MLEDLKVNVSDHLPGCCIIDFSLDKVASAYIHKQVNTRVQWAKVDTEVYTAAIEDSIPSINTDDDNLYGLDTTVRKVNNILNKASRRGPRRGKSTEKGRLG